MLFSKKNKDKWNFLTNDWKFHISPPPLIDVLWVEKTLFKRAIKLLIKLATKGRKPKYWICRSAGRQTPFDKWATFHFLNSFSAHWVDGVWFMYISFCLESFTQLNTILNSLVDLGGEGGRRWTRDRFSSTWALCYSKQEGYEWKFPFVLSSDGRWRFWARRSSGRETGN